MRTDYEALAARYDEDRERWSFARDDVLDALVASGSHVRVLDVGCGTGRWLASEREVIEASRATLLGADPSPAMLAAARAKGLDNLMLAPAETLPVAAGCVDYLVSSYCFHHYTDKERAVDEVARVLTADGVFRINNIEPASANGWWVYDFFPETIAVDAERFWPATRIGAALEQRGFTVDIELDSGPSQVPAREALADAERRVISQLAALDDAAYARGLTRLRSMTAAADATVTTTRSRLCLTARRR